jgi:hypothetical protein
MAEPIQAEFRDKMNAMAQGLDEVLNGDKHGKDRKVGFVLLVFPLGEVSGARTNYISNGERSDIVILLKEMVARFEGQPLKNATKKF